MGERRLERGEVVEGHDAGGERDVDLGAERAGAGDHPVAVEHGERLVDGAVVAPVHDRDLGPAGEVPREAEHEAVGVGRGHRHLPAGQPEPAAQLLGHPGGVRRWAAWW